MKRSVLRFVLLAALVSGAAATLASKAFAGLPNAGVACSGRDGQVLVSPNDAGNAYKVVFVYKGHSYLISNAVHWNPVQKSYLGRVTESTELQRDGTVQMSAPITVATNTLWKGLFIIQDPKSGSATLDWRELECKPQANLK